MPIRHRRSGDEGEDKGRKGARERSGSSPFSQTLSRPVLEEEVRERRPVREVKSTAAVSQSVSAVNYKL